MKRKPTGIILIVSGISLASVILMFSSEYTKQDNLLWNLIRSILGGEVVLRERVFTVIPDRDERVYAEFQAYRSEHREFGSLSEDEVIERFYVDHYKERMPRMEFQLKLKKKKIDIEQEQIALPYKYVFIVCVVFILAGLIMIITQRARKKRIREVRD